MDDLLNHASSILKDEGLRIDKAYHINVGVQKWSADQTDDCAVVFEYANNPMLRFRLGISVECIDDEFTTNNKPSRCGRKNCRFQGESRNDLAAHYFVHFCDGDAFIHNCCGNDMTDFEEFCEHYNKCHLEIKSIHLNFEKADTQVKNSNLYLKTKFREKVKFADLLSKAYLTASNFDGHFGAPLYTYEFIRIYLYSVVGHFDESKQFLLDVSLANEESRYARSKCWPEQLKSDKDNVLTAESFVETELPVQDERKKDLLSRAAIILNDNGLRIDEPYHIKVGVQKWSREQTDDCAVLFEYANNPMLRFRLGISVEFTDNEFFTSDKPLICGKSDCRFEGRSPHDLAAHYFFHFCDGDGFLHKCCGNVYVDYERFCDHFNKWHNRIKALHLNFHQVDSRKENSNAYLKTKMKRRKFADLLKIASRVAKNFSGNFKAPLYSCEFIRMYFQKVDGDVVGSKQHLLNVSLINEAYRYLRTKCRQNFRVETPSPVLGTPYNKLSTLVENENNHRYVDRTVELEEINKLLSMKTGKRAIVVHGISGSGKSELTRQFLNYYSGCFINTYVINGENDFITRKNLIDIVDNIQGINLRLNWGRLSTKDIVHIVFDAFGKEDVLIIFDNITRPRELHSWLNGARSSVGSNLCLLVTSDSTEFDTNYFDLVELKHLPEVTAIEYMKGQLLEYSYDELVVSECCKILQYHPLVLRVSASYVSKHNVPLKEFNAMISNNNEKNNSDILLYRLFVSLFSAINISISSIFMHGESNLIGLMCIISLMDGQELEWSLLLEFGSKPDETIGAIKELLDQSLIQKKDKGTFEMHALIRKFLKIELTKKDKTTKYIQLLLNMISTFQHKYKNDNTSNSYAWLHHVLPLIEEYQNNQDVMKSLESMKENIVDTLSSMGEYITLISCLETYLRYERNTNQPFSVILYTQLELACIWSSMGDYDKTIKTYEELCQQCQNIYGEESSNTLRILDRLATCMKNQGKFSEARVLYNQVFEIRKRIFGPENSATLISINNLAKCMSNLGEYDKAKTLYNEVVDVQKRILCGINPRTLNSINNSALCMESQGEYDEAKVLYKQVIETRLQTLGHDHPCTLNSMQNLALCMENQEEYDEASVMYIRIIETRKRIFGHDHQCTLNSIQKLAICLENQGKYNESRLLYNLILERRKRILGLEHHYTLSSMQNVALCMESQGEYAEASVLYNQMLETRKRILGLEHPHTLESMQNLAMCLEKQGKHVESRYLYNQILDRRKQLISGEHQYTLNSMQIVALCMESQEEFDEARERITYHI